jgi:hypothetical protein
MHFQWDHFIWYHPLRRKQKMFLIEKMQGLVQDMCSTRSVVVNMDSGAFPDELGKPVFHKTWLEHLNRLAYGKGKLWKRQMMIMILNAKETIHYIFCLTLKWYMQFCTNFNHVTLRQNDDFHMNCFTNFSYLKLIIKGHLRSSYTKSSP